MKSREAATLAFAALFVAMLVVNVVYVWHMAGLYERLQELENIAAGNPTQMDVADYIESNNGSAPPASWYPNGDPWRNFTAEESEEWLQYYEDKESK